VSLSAKKKHPSFFILAILSIYLCGACALIALLPIPDLDYLYEKYPEVKESIPNDIIGTRVQVFMDPSLYYKFRANEAQADQLAGLLNLSPVNYASHCFQSTGLFWHDWWWHPDPKNTSRLYNSYQKGDDICLIYDFIDEVIYLYIQNT
jgi:hypothetical protein